MQILSPEWMMSLPVLRWIDVLIGTPAWTEAATADLKIVDTDIGGLAQIDPKIRFFVRAIQNLGQTSLYSCQGHPSWAYVRFRCPPELGKRIRKACGPTALVIKLHGENTWEMHVPGILTSEAQRDALLRQLSGRWIRHGLAQGLWATPC